MDRKLVVFVPPAALDAVREAIFAAGGGHIGGYARCSWYTDGTGTFLPGDGTEPAIGERGVESRVPECRLETVITAECQADVLAAVLDAHPYEQPAYEVYELLS